MKVQLDDAKVEVKQEKVIPLLSLSDSRGGF